MEQNREQREQQGPKPDWWQNNETYRERFDLPEYEPPRFQDGTHTYRILEELEKKHDVTIRLLGVNTDFPDDIEVRISSRTLFSVGRHRTSNGNTIYEIAPDEFRRRIETMIQR